MKKVISRGDELYSLEVFKVLSQYEITRSQRYPNPITLIHLEIMPSASDEAALRAAPSIFCSALNSHIRSVDIPARSKNEYFLLLPTTDVKGGRAICERLLSVVRNKFETQDGKTVTFSLHIGFASQPGGSSLSYETLFEQAAAALKQSKLKGANTFVAFSD
jgi:hypothetical protein